MLFDPELSGGLYAGVDDDLGFLLGYFLNAVFLCLMFMTKRINPGAEWSVRSHFASRLL